ncbi:PhoH family protein [Candidatus Babeliales bacterium]|nr:PhoH family protein [Candidatus Babeliales bacterium]
MSKINYVLDTNVILHDPRSIYKFGEHNVFIPIYVLEEVDNFKSRMDEVGRNAREFCRQLDKLRKVGSLHSEVGVEVNDSGGMLCVYFLEDETPPVGTADRILMDTLIIMVAEDIRDLMDGETVLVTKDANMRIRADSLGMRVEDYQATKVLSSEAYKGHSEIYMTGKQISRMFKAGYVDLDNEEELSPNEYLVIRNSDDPDKTVLGKYDAQNKRVLPLNKEFQKRGVMGVKPRNVGQQFALDALMDPEIKLVTLLGLAGSGKTIMACAAGIAQVKQQSIYERVLVARPIMPMGKDIGFLPGPMEDKLAPYMQPIEDNISVIMGKQHQSGKSNFEVLKEKGTLEIEALTFIRGRSLPNNFMIIDEAQNLTLLEVKTILTRVGEGTKIVLTGDPDQIDSPHLDSESNGLSYVIKKFKDQSIAASITLTEGERSELATLAADIL